MEDTTTSGHPRVKGGHLTDGGSFQYHILTSFEALDAKLNNDKTVHFSNSLSKSQQFHFVYIKLGSNIVIRRVL